MQMAETQRYIRVRSQTIVHVCNSQDRMCTKAALWKPGDCRVKIVMPPLDSFLVHYSAEKK